MNVRKSAMASGRALLVLATATVGMLALAATASAARDPIAGGITDLHMKHGFLRKLGNNEITVSPLGAGTVDGNKIGLTVREGMLDPTDVEGHLEVSGGFKLSRGNRGVPVNKISVNTVKKKVYATIAKAHMELGEIGPLVATREGFGANFKAVKLTLTEKAARRISNRLGLAQGRRIAGGRVLSNLYATAQPSTVTLLPQGSATLTGNVATLGKFGVKGVEIPAGITAVAPATQPTPTSFQFPIAGGTIAPDGSAGTVQTSGGVQILKKTESLSPQMKLLNVAVDFAAKTATVELEITPAPPFPGAVGRSSIADVVLPAGSVSADPAARTITVTGAEAKLQAVAASTLNDVFNQPAPEPPPSSNFLVGDLLGTFAMTVQAE
jgi:hypothetical protein